MSSDHDIMRLPDPPPPAPDARAAALQQALVRFDQKSAEDSQGMPTGIRLIERTAAPLRPSRERSVMKRTRYLLAASLACVVAGSGVYLHLMRSPQLQDAAAPVEQQVASNDVAQAPSTVQAKKESESQAQSATANPNRHSGRKAQPGSRRAFGCRGAASRQAAHAKVRSLYLSSERAFRDGAHWVDGSHARIPPLPSARSGSRGPERSQPHARAVVSICAADGAGRSLAGIASASTFLMRPSLSAATSLPMRRKTPSRSRAMRRSRHSPLMSIRRRTRSSAHSSTAMCCRRPRRFGPRS